MTPAAWAGTAVRRTAALLPGRAEARTLRRDPKRDLIAGVTVAVVALPLALAFGITSGLGAAAGIATAVVAGAIAAIFGGSNLQVSGPTGAMTVVLVPIVAQFGASAVLVVGLMAGVLLLALAYARAGRYVRYLPLPVVEGFTVGIAIVIALQQVPAALGVPAEGEKVGAAAIAAVRAWLADPQWAPPALAAAVGDRDARRGATTSELGGVAAGRGGRGRPGHVGEPVGGDDRHPARRAVRARRCPTVPWSALSSLVVPAIAVAALGALESLLSATVADGMSVGEQHDPDKELFGQGLANLAVPFFGGIPATAAIARTAVNVRSGARSRLAAVVHALVILGRGPGAGARRGADPVGRPRRRPHRDRRADGRRSRASAPSCVRPVATRGCSS